MKLKFYLRGLGIGILVTWLIMGVINRNEVEAAKAQVKALYEQGAEGNLSKNEGTDGMQPTEESILIHDDTNENDNNNENDNIIDINNNENNNDINQNVQDGLYGASTEIDAGTDSESSPDTEQETLTIEDSSNNEQEDNVVIISSGTSDGQSVTITVSSGDDSGTVSRKLYNAGVIDNAAEYDAYLIQHGYDKKINPGTKIIYESDSWQTIAEKLTKRSAD